MKSKPELIIIRALENIRYRFDYLFKRGFRIASVLFVDQDNEKWQVVLIADNCLVQFHGDGEEMGLALSSLELCNEVGYFELHDLICLVNKEDHSSPFPETLPTVTMEGLSKTAWLLEKHMDDIWILIARIQRMVTNCNPGNCF